MMTLAELFLSVMTSPAFRFKIAVPEPPESPMETLVEATTVPFTVSAIAAPEAVSELIV